MTTTINQPKRFEGSQAEKDANHATHLFLALADSYRCAFCDCNSCGRTADYPCGAQIPREVVEIR